jgi:Xaa-Pro aminopeptidase
MKKNRQEAKRIARLRRIMLERGIDTLLVTQRENVRYLTGFTGSAGSLLMGTSGRTVLITDFRYKEQAKTETSGTRLLIQKKDQVSTIKAAADLFGTDIL